MSDEDIFYDTDCLSCFISINDVSILKILFKKIIIPHEVYREFSRIPILNLPGLKKPENSCTIMLK